MFKAITNAWQNRSQLGDSQRQSQELEFLPAALEIKERPPNPAGRITAWLLISLFFIAVVWACVGEVDIVAVAEGKVVPFGQVKQIQPYERGVVSEILVTEGQRVQQGDPLVILDRNQTGADLQRLQQENNQNRLDATRIKHFITLLNQPYGTLKAAQNNGATIQWPTDTTAASNTELQNQQNSQQLLLQQQLASYCAERAQLEQQRLDKAAEKQMNRAAIEKLEGTLPLITQRVDALRAMMQRKMAARVQYLELEQERVEQQYDLQGARARNLQLAAQLDELKQRQASLLAKNRRENLQQLIELDSQYASLQEELNKARDLNSKQVLTAPVNGIVQELAIHTVGGVVTPAQELMKIVPQSRQLIVEAWLENKDIGFVHSGQDAEIKIHTFPFTKYGVIEATVDNVSSDATVDENRGLIYKARMLLAKNTLQVDGREVNLVPGMGISAEVKTGKRYLIEYILTPLLRYKNESVKER